jgi:NAD(P)-dependent dehydrogenase (short-subunit alcohol dehydrogenase family)
VHNAGVSGRCGTPRTSADGHETTFAVNVLAPHLLTHLLSDELQGRMLWLGSGLAGSAR